MTNDWLSKLKVGDQVIHYGYDGCYKVARVERVTGAHLDISFDKVFSGRFRRADGKASGEYSRGELIEASSESFARIRHEDLVRQIQAVNHATIYHLPDEVLLKILKLMRVNPENRLHNCKPHGTFHE